MMDITKNTLSAHEIKNLLNADGETLVKVYEQIDSTNAEAKRLAANGIYTDALIVADSQTAGRGRLGRSFYSPKGTGLYMSYLYTPATDINDHVVVTAAAAVAVCRALKRLCHTVPKIKWVNDIYVDSKKVCGILTEAVQCHKNSTKTHIIVGIGINLTTTDFPDDLKGVAASLNSCDTSRNRLAAEITAELKSVIGALPSRAFLKDYREMSLVLGKEVTYTKNGISNVGTATDIDQNGGLVVLANGQTVTLSTGEISVKIN